MMPIVNVANLTEHDRRMLTSYYRHWNLCPKGWECVGYRDDRPVFRPEKEEEAA